jgi:hypothetical protein
MVRFSFEKPGRQFRLVLILASAGIFSGRNGQSEGLRKDFVGMHPVVGLIVVVAWIGVLIPAELIRSPI